MKEKFRLLHQKKLEISMDTLRDILDEMCCTIDEREVNIEKLTVSQQLDKVIVEYMSLKKGEYPDSSSINMG